MATPMMQPQQFKRLTGVVVSAGKMMKTVKVRITEQRWNKQIQKHYASHYNVLVSDPADSTLQGDVVTIRSGWRSSKHVRHVVESIISPMTKSVSERPAVPTEVERLAQRATKRAEKDVRQAARGRQPAMMRLKSARQAEGQRKVESRMLLGELEAKADELLGQVREKNEANSVQGTADHDTRLSDIEASIEAVRQDLSGLSLTQQEAEQVSSAYQTAAQTEQAALDSGAKEVPESVEGGATEVGDLNQRSLHNVRRTINWREKAEANEEKIEELEKKQAQSDQGMTPPEEIVKPGEENQNKKGWFGSIFGGGKQ